MRSINALASLLLIFLIFLSNEAQGIRLGNYWMMNPVGQLEKTLIIGEESVVIEEGFRKIDLCKNGHANSGNNRKLLTATSPSSTTRKEEGNKKGNSKAVSENLETGLEHYPDLIDIAEMDYSPATRKPPIHN